MSELGRLFDNISACRDSLKRVTDSAVDEILRLKEEALQAEADHDKQKAAYLENISRLNEELVAIRKAEMHERRALQHLKEQQENTKRMIERAKQDMRRKLDEASQLSRA